MTMGDDYSRRPFRVRLVTGAVVVILAQVSLGEVPFRRVAVDDSVKNPWAKIIADIDKDGFPDIVIGGRGGPLVWYKYPDWTKAIIADGGYRTVDGEAGDVDGSVDIAASEMHQGEDPDEVAVFLNRGQGLKWDKQILSTRGSHCIQAGDIGSDGDMDLMGANWSGPFLPVELWENLSRNPEAKE